MQKEEEKVSKRTATLDDFMVVELIVLERLISFVGPKIQTSWPGHIKLLKRLLSTVL